MGEIKVANLSWESTMNTDHEKLSDTDIERIVRQFRDNLNFFLELLIDCGDQWNNFGATRRQSRLIQLRRHYSPIIDLGKVIADYCLINNDAIDETDIRALEGLGKMKEFLESDQAHSLGVPWTLFCASIVQLSLLLPEDLAITNKGVIELIASRSL